MSTGAHPSTCVTQSPQMAPFATRTEGTHKNREVFIPPFPLVQKASFPHHMLEQRRHLCQNANHRRALVNKARRKGERPLSVAPTANAPA